MAQRAPAAPLIPPSEYTVVIIYTASKRKIKGGLVAFDPLQEDCNRLVLEALRRNDASPDDGQFINRCIETYRTDPDSLIVTDRDRSFHLTAKAAGLIDYRIPFMTDEAAAEQAAQQAEDILREALSLDDSNWDARRMLFAITAKSAEEYLAYLQDNLDEVKRIPAEANPDQDEYTRQYNLDLGRRAYLRWLGALASRLLISGRYKLALDVAKTSLSFAPDDPGDIRYTALYALAKLEASTEEIMKFRDDAWSSFHGGAWRQFQPQSRRSAKEKLDPWTQIALMSAAWHALELDDAERYLRELARSYPRAADVLYCQTEFPDGIYARVQVAPQSLDELVLALSEATPLLQEGLGAPDNASFAYWVATNDAVISSLKDKKLINDAQQIARGGGER